MSNNATYHAGIVKFADVIGWVFTVIVCVGMLTFAAMSNSNASAPSQPAVGSIEMGGGISASVPARVVNSNR